MSNYRLFKLLMILGLLLSLSLTACTSQAEVPSPPATSAPTETLVQKIPITLRFAISDAENAPSSSSVQNFVDLVQELSDGNIIIEPVWEAGEDTTPGFEQGVIAAVKSGEYDLGLAGSRAFDLEGVNAFQALQTPFLIDSDAMAIAVAESNVAVRMLDKTSTQGLTGLTLWPEDLRHPFSVVPGKSFIKPEDFAGENIRSTPSSVSYALIEAFGGKPVFGNSDYQGAESGLRQGFSLTGQPIATGNVNFFPKYQVLFANRAVFDKLMDAQRAILRESAAGTQKKAIAERPSEVEAGATWCAENGTIVLASKEQMAAFEKAAQPVLALIEQDPENAELITAIRELKTKTPPSPGVEACGSEVAQQSSTQDPDTQTWSDGLPPNGVWQVELASEDVIRMGVSEAKAPLWSGIYTLTIQDGDYKFFWQGTVGQEVGNSFECLGTYEVVEDFVRITYTDGNDCEDEIDDIQWQLDDQGQLFFHLVAIHNAPFIENKAYLEAKPYQKIADQ